MNFIEILGLGLALAVDVFGIAFAYGLIIKRHRNYVALRIAGTCGFMQFIMPYFGYFGTSVISGCIARFDYILVCLVFTALGLNIIREALSDSDNTKLKRRVTWKVAFTIGLATSIDALVSGSMLYLTKTPLLMSTICIGLISFIVGIVGFNLNCCFKKIPEKYLEISAGLILIALGLKNLLAHFI